MSPFKKAQIPEEKEEEEDNIKDEDLQQLKATALTTRMASTEGKGSTLHLNRHGQMPSKG